MHYAGDITRTFPVNGRFNVAQREIYELVLEAQAAAIDKVHPGNHWNDPHKAAVRVLAQMQVAQPGPAPAAPGECLPRDETRRRR